MRILDNGGIVEQLDLFPYPISRDKCRKCSSNYEEIAWRNGEAVAWLCSGSYCYIVRRPTEWEKADYLVFGGARPSYL